MVDPIEYFTGGWTFSRQVEDRIADLTGAANGIAMFEEQGDGLLWVETAELRITGRSFEASRRMSITREGERWLVRFEDGRPFHYLDLSSGQVQMDHLCVADLYSGHLKIEPGPNRRFSTSWRVKGPAKDQTLSTEYTALD
jgi:hypothetical protein